jgi:hypothetical protein
MVSQVTKARGWCLTLTETNGSDDREIIAIFQGPAHFLSADKSTLFEWKLVPFIMKNFDFKFFSLPSPHSPIFYAF